MARSDSIAAPLIATILLAAAFRTCATTSIPLPPSPAPPTTSSTPTMVSATACIQTIDDGLSPSYKAGTPLRASVGHGHVLTGTVRSSLDCSPIPNAQVELWPEYPDQGHPDDARATVFTDSMGDYRFECDPPEHIHMRISAAGYVTVAQNSYHPEGQPAGTFDVVLEPDKP